MAFSCDKNDENSKKFHQKHFFVVPPYGRCWEFKRPKLNFLKEILNVIEITDKRPDVWSRPLCTYRGIISTKKTVVLLLFWVQKNFFFIFLKKRYYVTFQCGRYNAKKN